TIRLVRNRRFSQWSTDAQPAGFPDAIEITWPPLDFSPQQVSSKLTHKVENGQTDVATFSGSPPLSRATLDELETRYPSQLRLTLSLATWYVFLNTLVTPFDDPRVRQAVATGLDRAP